MSNFIPESEVQGLLTEIGIRIRTLRTQKEWSQEKLGFLADSSQNSIKRIESGQQNPRIGMLYRIAHALDINVSEIIDYATKQVSQKGRKRKDKKTI